MITIDKSVFEKYPNAKFGILCINGFQAVETSDFIAVKDNEIAMMRNKYNNYERKNFMLTDPVCHYVRYYKQFKKTYHVLHQLESIILKDKTIPDVEPLVQAMFLSEVKHCLLTAGHDLDEVEQPLTVSVAKGSERYIGAAGQEIELAENDIYMRDSNGVIVSIIYGPDSNTLITKKTRNAMFFIYGVEGITRDKIMSELEDIFKFLRLFDQKVEATYMDVLQEDAALFF